MQADFIFKVEAAFLAVSEQIVQNLGGFDNWMKLGIDDKLLQFTSFLSNMRKDLRLGGITGIYILYKNNLSLISEEIRRVIIEEVFTTIKSKFI
jgi:hypothetical protein